MLLLYAIIAALSSAYIPSLSSKIEKMHAANSSVAGARVILLDDHELLDVFHNSSDTWHILLLDSTGKRARVANSSWGFSAKALYTAHKYTYMGKILLEKSRFSMELFNVTEDPAIVTMENGYFYVHYGQMLTGEITDIVGNKTFLKLPYNKIPNWNGETKWMKVIKRTVFSFSGVIFIGIVIFACFLKVTKKFKQN